MIASSLASNSTSSTAVPRSSAPVRLLRSLLQRRHGLALIALGLALFIGLVTRAALLAKAAGEVAWDTSLLGSFLVGAAYDLGGAAWWLLPLVFALALLPRGVFASRAVRAAAHAGLVVLWGALLFGAVAEWLFWDEFGVRFNFIAVDYLVYTTEVIGNIRESYPMPVIFGALALASLGLHLLLVRTGVVAGWLDHAAEPARARWRSAALWAAALLIAGLGLDEGRIPAFANNYNRELAKSGLWSLFAAFRANQLDYERFYPTMPDDAAFERMHRMLARDGSARLSLDSHDLLRRVTSARPERPLNVVQITVESLSADFLTRYGNRDGLTPNLDALIPRALVFDNFYATGTRTDRGMEALTLSVPPTPGRSLVKRPDNEHLFTLGSVLRGRGYETSFIYGGFGYFDNMNHFFGENGYRVTDRTAVARDDITFANVWGACDEDLFRWTLRAADQDHASGKPFFYFVMTTSNHRPFTYPDGKIDLPSKVSGRSGGVKYTDHAIGELLRAAATKPWYNDTVFVIVADHCASSAGKSELPVQNYHIPLIVFAPGGQIAPGVVKTLASQVDYAPTLLDLLGGSYDSRFYGHSVVRPGGEEFGRALIGNYQKLGLYRDGQLGVLKPVRQSATFAYDAATHEATRTPLNNPLLDDAIANYQTASWLFKNGRQRALAPAIKAETLHAADGN